MGVSVSERKGVWEKTGGWDKLGLVGIGEKDMSYTNNHHIEANAVQRVASLPLFDSALKTVVSVYTDVKGGYPLLSVVGGVAEIGVRNVSQAAILRATPLLLSLEPQIEVVNNYACMGLDQLENNFPVLHQSTEEVLGHLKDAFFLTLDDVQLRVNDELDGIQGRWDKLTDATWYYLLALQESQLGQMATSGLDDILTRSEEAMAKYMPLTATLRLEWERRTQQYEDEDGEDEPGLWTRFRGLLLCLSLQLYHRLLKLRNRLERAMGMLQDATDRVLRLEAMRRLALDQLKAQVRVLAELGPINQLLGLPAQVQLVVADLQELGKILLQLLVKGMLQQPSDQDVEDFLNQQESLSSDTTRSSSASSLFLKAIDGRPHNRKSSYARSQTGSTSAPSPASAKSPNGSRGSQKQDDQTLSLELKNLHLPSTIALCRRSSVRRGSSSSINPPDPSPVPGPAPANPGNDDDQSLSRQGSQKHDDQPLSRQGSQKPDDQPLACWGSQKQEDQLLFVELDSNVCHRSSAIEFLLAPIIQYLSPEQLSDETVIPEVETTNFHPDTRDESLPRHQSLSARFQRSSSSAGNPDDQSLSRWGSQKQDDQPLSLELDPLELPSTSTVRRPSSAAEVLLGSILQYLISEPPSDESIIPEVETTKNHTETRDEGLPRLNSLSSSSQLSLSSAVAPVVEITEDLSPEQGSDKAVALEVESIEYYSDTRDMSPPRCKSLSARSRRSSSSVVATEVETTEGLRPEQVSDEVIAFEVESTEYYSDARDESPSRRKSLSAHSRRSSSNAGNLDDQPLSNRGSQKPDDQPLSLQLDPQELPSTSTMCRPSSAAEVLLGSILQYLSSEPPSDESIVPEVETTKNHTETRDEGPPRHKSLSAHSRKSSSSAGNSDNQPLSRCGSQKPDDQPLSCRGNQMSDDQPLSLELDPLELPSTSTVRRPSSAAEVLLGSVLQYINSEPSSDEPFVPKVETTENHIKARVDSLPRLNSLSSSSQLSLSSAVAPVVEITEDLSPEQGSDKAVALEVESIEYYSDTRDMSPPRCKSLSARSRRSSSSVVATEVETTDGLRPEQVSDEVIAFEVKSTEYYSDARDESPSRRKSLSAHSRRSSSNGGNPDDQPLSNRGSQKPDDQPLSLQLDPLELPSTSTMRRPSSAAEVLLGSILQYLSSEPPSDESIIPEVETTKNHTETRDEGPPRHKSLYAHSHKSSSSAGNSDNQPLSRRGSQKPDDQPLSRRGNQMSDDQPLSLELDPLELPSTSTVRRPSSAAEVLLGSVLQYINSEPSSDEPFVPKVETTENHIKARVDSLPRLNSLSSSSHLSLSSAVAPVVEITEDLSPEQGSDKAVALEVESVEYYSDTRDMSPPRCKSLSARSRRSSSSVVATEVETTEGMRPEQVSDEVIAFEVESTEYYSDARDESPSRRKSLSAHSCISSSNAGNPDDQPLSNRGSQKPDDQPLSLQLDPLELPSTSTILLGSILQYISSELPLEEPVVPEMDNTENTEVRYESPPRCKSLSVRSRRSSSSAGNPSNVCQGSQMRNDQPLSVEFDILDISSTSALRRRSSAAEVLLGPILQYLSSEPPSDETIMPKVETTENQTEARDESPPRHKSLFARSHRSSYSASAPEMETTEDQSPEKVSDEAIALEGESTEYYSDARDVSPSRSNSLSAGSHRSSSSAGNLDVQPLSRRGSQKPDDQPLSLELDPLELPSTSTMRRPSSAAEVLLGSILQYISSEPPLEEPVVPEVDSTENTDVRDESPPRYKSLSVRSRRSSSSAGNPSNVRQGSQMRNDQPRSVEFDILDISSTSALRRRSLAAEVLLGPILQYLSSEPSSDETVIPEVETTEKNAQLRDESPPRCQSLSPRSRRSSSSAVVPEVETTEYCSDEGDSSPLRRKSLSIRSRRSSSSGGNAPSPRLTPDNTHNGLQASQMQDNLDELDTSAVRRRSWAVEVLLDPILQYLNPGHSEKADIEEAEIPAVEATEH
ncbi:uncharacterized protein LOC118367690 isoform X2 [Oncorhynchus keta]|uniref:uncharacterized protein LOC118367690 isoform X2 n=1 Tax=Oncorhynchus keta TaxID=8018 RepID=UPI00227C00F4|nr:uncharacterized protein LOC118367690 isoform X2 [Oncorhynchus keta]